MAKILVACEFSQMVTNALRAVGHETYSCDLLDTEGNPDWHIKGDAVEAAYSQKWDAMIAHPECTHLTLAGARWFYDPRFPNKAKDRDEAIAFWLKLKAAPISKKAFENPQPLGYVTETKGVCLWLEGLPPLIPTVTKKPEIITARVWRMGPGPNRKKERSRFFQGIADAMADQWNFNR
jgi:hypothetical protein